jgi:hypothetical protein
MGSTEPVTYIKLVVDALGAKNGNLSSLGQKVAFALGGQLPERTVREDVSDVTHAPTQDAGVAR